MKKMLLGKSKLVGCALALASLAGLTVSCQEDMKDYYEEPNWLKGSIYEILEDNGNYSLFLKGVDLCDYTDLLKGRSILTVMAPDDASMSSYLQTNYGTTDLEALPLSEVKKLIGFHLLYYSFDSQKLRNFRPLEGDGATEEEKEVNAGLYYKFRTRSQDAPTQVQASRMIDASGAIVDTVGVTVDIYHLERFIPVFSKYMFQTKVIDAKKNYEYFFPNTEWKGDDASSLGFNVSDAVVTNEQEVIAKNGYIYYVDRVIRPLETIYKELESNSDYSQYLALYDQYGYYTLNEDLTNTYGGGTKTYYSKYYQSSYRLPNIWLEWPVSIYSEMATLSRASYSIFAPTNSAFDNFYRDYWGQPGTGYPTEVSYDSIASDAIGYLLSNSVYSSLCFPEEITNGDIQNATTGTVISFDPEGVPQANRRMCVNGVLYGQSILTPPAVFGSVSGPAYQYKKYNLFLQFLNRSAMLSELFSDQVKYIVLYPNDAQFESNEIWYDSISGNIKSGLIGSTTAVNLGSSAQSQYAKAHIINLYGATDALPEGSGVKVYRTFADNKLYIYVKDGKISNSYKLNNLLQYAGNMEPDASSVWTDFDEILFRGEEWSNGHCYAYDTQNNSFLLPGNLDNATYANFVPLMYAHRNDEGTLFQGFIQLLMKADMIDEQAQTMNYQTENCIMLIPTTMAIKQAILAGTFPHVITTATSADDADFWNLTTVKEGELEALQHYMLQYFLPESTSPATEYPYLGWEQDTEGSGGIPSIQDVQTTPATCVYINIYDRGSQLTAKVTGSDKEIAFYSGYDYLPFVFNDGCIQFMEGIFDDVWPVY